MKNHANPHSSINGLVAWSVFLFNEPISALHPRWFTITYSRDAGSTVTGEIRTQCLESQSEAINFYIHQSLLEGSLLE